MDSSLLFCGATANNNSVTINNGFASEFESNSGWGDGIGGSKIGSGVTEIPSFGQSNSGRMALCAIVVKRSQTALGLNEPTYNFSKGHKLFPNPSSNILNIDFDTEECEKEISIYNIEGKLIYDKKTTQMKNVIDIKSLNLNGVIIVKINDGKSVYVHKVILK